MISFQQVAAIPFGWPTFLANSANRAPFYASFEAAQASAAAPPTSSISKPKQGASEDAIRKEILSLVQNVVGSAVGENVPLVQAGLDSLGEAH